MYVEKDAKNLQEISRLKNGEREIMKKHHALTSQLYERIEELKLERDKRFPFEKLGEIGRLMRNPKI